MLNLQLCLKMSLLDHSVSLTIKHLFPTLFSSWTKSIIHAAALWVWNCYQASLELFVHSCWRKKKKIGRKKAGCPNARLYPSACLFHGMQESQSRCPFPSFPSCPHLPCMVCSPLLLPVQGGPLLHVGGIAHMPHEWHFLMSFVKIAVDLWGVQVEIEKSERDQKYFVLDLHESDTGEVSIACICQKTRTSWGKS